MNTRTEPSQGSMGFQHLPLQPPISGWGPGFVTPPTTTLLTLSPMPCSALVPEHRGPKGLAPPLRALPTHPSFSALPHLEMIWGGSRQLGSTAAAKLAKRFILRFMQNSLCGDRGGLRFNIHADLEEMFVLSPDNLHFCFILLLLAPWASPRAPLASSPAAQSGRWSWSCPASPRAELAPQHHWADGGAGGAAVEKSYESFWGILTGNR